MTVQCVQYRLSVIWCGCGCCLVHNAHTGRPIVQTNNRLVLERDDRLLGLHNVECYLSDILYITVVTYLGDWQRLPTL